MTRLLEIQDQFATLMYGKAEALKNLPADFSDLFVQDEIDLSTRLNIYRNNSVGSLTDIIVSTFPLIEKLIGKDFLQGMARLFVLSHPPQQACLNLYGDGFAEFIANFPQAATMPYLPDMARLELAINAAYYAADETLLRSADLAQVDPSALNDLVLKLHGSVSLLNPSYPVLALREICLDPELPAPDLQVGVTPVLIMRRDLRVEIIPLDQSDYMLITQLKVGHKLGSALQSVLLKYPDFDFAVSLKKYLALEIFVNPDNPCS